MKSYQKFLETVQTPGVAAASARKPVFRASSIFPVRHGRDWTSRVSLFGYWMIKREIREVTALLTLRDAGGAIVGRRTHLLERPEVLNAEVGEWLSAAGWTGEEFLGSLEVEIFSSRNLVFTYPAIVLTFYNDRFSTAVHTAGRIYNDIEDRMDNEECAVPESGFDIHAAPGLRPFFAFTNGPLEDPAARVRYAVVDAGGREHAGELALGDLAPYETRFVDLSKEIPLAKMLTGGAGTIRLRHAFKGFFPRLICGNLDDNTGSASITHTYYDCSAASAPSDYWNAKNPANHDAAILMPVFGGDRCTELVFYPIYSPGNFSFALDYYNREGGRLSSAPPRPLGGRVFERVRLDEGGKGAEAANLIFNADGPVPTRIKMGFNVGIRGSRALPCNICFAPKIGDPDAKKTRSFHWAPFVNVGRSVVVVTNGSPQKEYKRPAAVRLRFYRMADDRVLEREETIPPFGHLRLDAGADGELRGFFGGKTGWAVFESENPYVYGWYFDFNGAGVAAGDHCF